MEKIEYRVRPVMRYVVTRYHRSGHAEGPSGVVGRGEYDNAAMAYEVAYALCKQEHEALGYPPGDTRIQYPAPLHQGVEIGGTSLEREFDKPYSEIVAQRG